MCLSARGLCVFWLFLTFDQSRKKKEMASVNGETKCLFFLRLLIVSIPACTGFPGGQSPVSSTYSRLVFLLLLEN